MNETELKQALIQTFGTRIEPHMEDILNRISMVITAKVYAGNQGDNSLAQLNQFFETHNK